MEAVLKEVVVVDAVRTAFGPNNYMGWERTGILHHLGKPDAMIFFGEPFTNEFFYNRAPMPGKGSLGAKRRSKANG